MTKIEIQVVDNNNGKCNVKVGLPKILKSTTETEKMVATSVKLAIDNTINNLSKGNN